MARRWTDGAEFGDVLFWDVPNGMVQALSTPASPRSGSYYYYVYKSTGFGMAYKLFGDDLSEFYLRICILPTSSPFDQGYIGWSCLGVEQGSMKWDVYKRPVLYLGITTLTATGIHPRDAGWNCYEIYVKIAETGGRVIIKQNGITEIDFTGDTFIDADTADAFFAYCSTSAAVQLDDLAFNDTSGAANNSWCGDGHIERLDPNANGDLSEWLGSDGNQIDNYALVDEKPPTGDTDNVYSSVPGDRDIYNLSAFDPTDKVITRVWAECRARDANSMGGEIKIGFKTGGTVYLCAANRVLPSVYTKIVGDDAEINPYTGVAWTDADLDALQFVIECE